MPASLCRRSVRARPGPYPSAPFSSPLPPGAGFSWKSERPHERRGAQHRQGDATQAGPATTQHFACPSRPSARPARARPSPPARPRTTAGAAPAAQEVARYKSRVLVAVLPSPPAIAGGPEAEAALLDGCPACSRCAKAFPNAASPPRQRCGQCGDVVCAECCWQTAWTQDRCVCGGPTAVRRAGPREQPYGRASRSGSVWPRAWVRARGSGGGERVGRCVCV